MCSGNSSLLRSQEKGEVTGWVVLSGSQSQEALEPRGGAGISFYRPTVFQAWAEPSGPQDRHMCILLASWPRGGDRLERGQRAEGRELSLWFLQDPQGSNFSSVISSLCDLGQVTSSL